MRHKIAGRTLGRNATHRAALKRNLARALIEHGRIITTVEKAKEVRPFIEKLITLAKKGTLHARRLAIARLHDPDSVKRLFAELAERYADRKGGYTRIIKRHERRLGDGGKTAFLELLKPGETSRIRKGMPAAPAPITKVEEPTFAPVTTPAAEPATPPPTENPPTP